MLNPVLRFQGAELPSFAAERRAHLGGVLEIILKADLLVSGFNSVFLSRSNSSVLFQIFSITVQLTISCNDSRFDFAVMNIISVFRFVSTLRRVLINL